MENSYAAHVAAVLPNVATGGAPVRRDEQVIHKATRAISASSGVQPKKEYGRNDRVVITNGTEKREMKFKKAEPLLATGEWRVVE